MCLYVGLSCLCLSPGPIQEPLYLIRFSTSEDVKKLTKVIVGGNVFYALMGSKPVNQAACHVKGSGVCVGMGVGVGMSGGGGGDVWGWGWGCGCE